MEHEQFSPSAEDALDFPRTWRRRLYPRRGGRPGPAVRVDRSAPAGLRARVRELEAARPLAGRDGVGPAMAAAVRDHLAGAADPLGAAVVAALLVEDGRHDEVGRLAVLAADAWVTEHGLPFAACAFAEFSQILWGCPGLRSIGHRPSWSGRSVASTAAAKAGVRLRALLAVAGDGVHGEAAERLAAHRRTPSQRVVASFLMPTLHDWVDECCAAPPDRVGEADFWWMLYCSLGSARQVEELVAAYGVVHHYAWDRAFLVTVADGLGAAVTPLLVRAFDADAEVTALRRLILETLAVLPGDAAFQSLVDRSEQKYVRPALIAAMNRFPVRAARLLAPAAAGSAELAELLAAHLRTHADVPPGLPGLPAAPAAPGSEELPDAPADVLPRVLADPPWLRTPSSAEPVIVGGFAPPPGPVMRWAPGERERWARPEPRHERLRRDDWGDLVEEFRAGRDSTPVQLGILLYGPEDEVRPLVPGWKPKPWDAELWMTLAVARFETGALPAALAAAEADPAGHAGPLLPFLDAGVAALMTRCLARPRRGRTIALAWFARHGVDAAPLLVPAALGRPGAARREAEDALRLLADAHGSEHVVRAVRVHGDEAAAAVGALLAADPLHLLPARMPVPGAWADVRLLPRIRLRGRDDALPAGAARHLLTMLALSRPERVYAGVAVVREVCDPASLAAFAWALFELWGRSGAPSRDGWALAQLGWLGNDETARRLAPLIRAWPGEGGHARAVAGLDVLAAIGSDVALMHLHAIARNGGFKGLRARARERLEEVARRRGLTAEQLGDRLVPGFGLDATGGLVLDYGARRFTVGFDDRLQPYVAAEDGTRLKALPRPGAKDDPELAPAAYERFAALRKDVRTLAADQVRRLESAMVARRAWTAGEFRRLFTEHPLIWHLARRLVWIAEDGGAGGAGGAATAFRLAEDGTLAGVGDDVLPLPETARVRVAHPVDLGEALGAWVELFADYEISQPFPQLDRPVHALSAAERAARRLGRHQGALMPAEAVRTLERRGWRRCAPMDAGLQDRVFRAVPGGLYVNVRLTPGVSAGRLDDGPQRLAEIRLDDRPGDAPWAPGRPGLPFGDLDPITASEVLTDLAEATA